MEDFISRLTDSESIVHIMALYAFVISVGNSLGRLKCCGISLGVTFVLFTGIIVSHFGFTCPLHVMNVVQSLGLVIFVYCVGLQCGPGFSSNFQKEGFLLNKLAIFHILMNVALCLVLFFLFFYRSAGDSKINADNLAKMVSTLCGAVTSTPSFGAVGEACSLVFGKGAPHLANYYACTYPVGVLGVIFAILLLRRMLSVNLKEEADIYEKEHAENPLIKPHLMTLQVTNARLEGMNMMEVRKASARDFHCLQQLHDGHVLFPTRDTLVHQGDMLYIVCAKNASDEIAAMIGNETYVDWTHQEIPLVRKRILVSEFSMNGKTFGELHFRSKYGVNIIHIRRDSTNLYAHHDLFMQIGDEIEVTGPAEGVEQVAILLGNNPKKLESPTLGVVGILFGVLFGTVPFSLPGCPIPLKLGMAGGSLIFAILLSRFGYKLRIRAYISGSANQMLRSLGLALFFASVGIKSGSTFMDTLLHDNGFTYMCYGFLITFIPVILTGLLARWKYKLNFLVLSGLMAGVNTNAAVLTFANNITGSNVPTKTYSCVYPLTLLSRILTAELLILVLCTQWL